MLRTYLQLMLASAAILFAIAGRATVAREINRK